MKKMRKNHSNKNSRRGIKKDLKLLAACPLCKSEYKPAQALVLDERGGRHLLYIKCGKCENAVLALTTIGVDGISSIGMVTDLSPQDALRFKDSFSISTDDVIGLHKLLKEERHFIEKLIR